MLSNLKKKQNISVVMDNGSGDGSVKKVSKVMDLDGLLNKLRAKIKVIHIKNISQGEVDAKPTLGLLNEIESRVIKYIRNVARRRRRAPDDVSKVEKGQGLIYKDERNKIMQAEKDREEQEKNDRMNLQRAKKRYRVGKQPAIRSRKQDKKVKEKEKEIDPER